MPSPISRRPQGLLDLLLTQQQGKNPSDLLDTVQPIVDMTQFYQTDRVTVEQGAGVMTAVGQNVDITIPSGEAWKVYTASSFCTFATVDQEFGAYLTVRNIPSASPVLSNFGGTRAAVGATDQSGVAENFPAPLIYPSGAVFRFTCAEIDLDGQANINHNVRILYIRMEV